MTLKRYAPAFPKPKDAREPKAPAFKKFDDGREVCYTVGTVKDSVIGRAEYSRRARSMWERQNRICCLFGHAPNCPGTLAVNEITFEHQNGRGGGKRDDRIEIDGKWINGAAHLLCNQWKSSRSVDYNTALQQRIVA
jgi:hypothetical protein